MKKIREYVESIGSAVVIALLIRFFIVEPFKIPSASMVPTLLIGDHIFVNKFIYGLRIPLTKIRFLQYRSPERGEVIVFIYPPDESKDYIKRVIGLPGDKVKLSGEDVYINGEKLDHTLLKLEQDPSEKRRLLVEGDAHWTWVPYVNRWKTFNFYNEAISDVNHLTQYEQDMVRPDHEYTVPENHYFVMGDNRDNSADSREWGFVPMDNVKGKAMFVWLSWDDDFGGIRWKRFSHWIH